MDIEEIHDIVGRLAMLVYRIESRRTSRDEKRDAEAELARQSAKLNELLNPKPPKIRRKTYRPGQQWFMPRLSMALMVKEIGQ